VPEEHRPAEWRPFSLWIASLAGFRGKVVAEIVQAYADVRGVALQRSCKPVQVWGAWPNGKEIVHVWIPILAGLIGMAQQRS
jgi:hypothetical protein